MYGGSSDDSVRHVWHSFARNSIGSASAMHPGQPVRQKDQSLDHRGPTVAAPVRCLIPSAPRRGKPFRLVKSRRRTHLALRARHLQLFCAQPLTIPRSFPNTRGRCGYLTPRSLLNVTRKIAPHFTPGLSNIFFCYMNVQICPQSQKALSRFFRTVLGFRELHKVQHFLLLVRWQVAKLLED